MPTPTELSASYTPRRSVQPGWSQPVVDIEHAAELTAEVAAEIEAMRYAAKVAAVAAGAFVNCKGERDFGLLGSHNADPALAGDAWVALNAWIEARCAALAMAAE